MTYLFTPQQYMSYSPLTHGQMYTGEERSCYKDRGSWSYYRTPGQNHILDLSKQKQHKSCITIMGSTSSSNQLMSVSVCYYQQLATLHHFASISLNE